MKKMYLARIREEGSSDSPSPLNSSDSGLTTSVSSPSSQSQPSPRTPSSYSLSHKDDDNHIMDDDVLNHSPDRMVHRNHRDNYPPCNISGGYALNFPDFPLEIPLNVDDSYHNPHQHSSMYGIKPLDRNPRDKSKFYDPLEESHGRVSLCPPNDAIRSGQGVFNSHLSQSYIYPSGELGVRQQEPHPILGPGPKAPEAFPRGDLLPPNPTNIRRSDCTNSGQENGDNINKVKSFTNIEQPQHPITPKEESPDWSIMCLSSDGCEQNQNYMGHMAYMDKHDQQNMGNDAQLTTHLDPGGGMKPPPTPSMYSMEESKRMSGMRSSSQASSPPDGVGQSPDTMAMSLDGMVQIKQEPCADSVSSGCTVTSSGRNRGCGRMAEPKYDCQICGDVAAGFHCGAFVCEACKKFYLRCLKSGSNLSYTCPKNQKCVITKETRSHCQHCRFKKCADVGMYKPGREDNKQLKVDFKSIPCKVCGAPSSGFHFGAITCEGCKGFFRRMVKEQLHRKFVCTSGGKCTISLASRTSCKACRFTKCGHVGMRLEGTRLGRQSNSVKRSTLLQYQQRHGKDGKRSGGMAGNVPDDRYSSDDEAGESCISSSPNSSLSPRRVASMSCPASADSSSVNQAFFARSQSYTEGTDRDRHFVEHNKYNTAHVPQTPIGTPVNSFSPQQEPSPAKISKGSYERQHSISSVKTDSSCTTPSTERSRSPQRSNGSHAPSLSRTVSDNSLLSQTNFNEICQNLLQDQVKLVEDLTTSYEILDGIMERPEVMNQWQPDPACLSSVWEIAAVSFLHHSKVVLKFIRKVPGFKQLPVEDQIHLVQESVYPISLMYHSKYYNLETHEYNWFIHTPEERDFVLKHFPIFGLLAKHFRHSGYIFKYLDLDPVEYALLAAIDVYRADESKTKLRTEIASLQETFTEILCNYCSEADRGGLTRAGILLTRMAELHRSNMEHVQMAIDAQKQNPSVSFSQLWEEIFLNQKGS